MKGSIAGILLLIFTFCSYGQSKIVLINKRQSWQNMGFSFWQKNSARPVIYPDIIRSPQFDKRKFYFEIPTDVPVFVNFSAAFKMQLVCLFPGDTLEFSDSKNDTLPFTFSGTRPVCELMLYSSLEKKGLGLLNNNYGIKITPNLNFNYILEQTRKRYDERLGVLMSEAKERKISQEGLELISMALAYQHFSELLFPFDSQAGIEVVGESIKYIPLEYKNILRELEPRFHLDSLLFMLDYKRFCKRYARFLFFEQHEPFQVNIQSELEFYKNSFEGDKRELMLFDELMAEYERAGSTARIRDYIDFIKTPSLRAILVSVQAPEKFVEHEIKLREAIVESSSGDRVSISEILERHKGKIVYLDFWATWCAPCLLEMPASAKLREEFRDQKVEFIYLSIDDDREKWKRKIQVLPVGAGAIHYRFVDSELFLKDIKLNGIPRYILLDSLGQVLSSDAPRPGSKEIRELLFTSLKK